MKNYYKVPVNQPRLLGNEKKYLKFRPNTKIEYGVKKFIDWYLSYNN